MEKMRLSNKFYDRESIEQAIEDYSGICRIQILDDAFTLAVPEDCAVCKEFCNYVLGIMITNRKA